MKNALIRILLAGAASLALFAGAAHAAPTVGQAAPDFTLTDINGQKHALSEYKGKTVVLEWVNPECPFVVKHYEGSGNLPATQKAAAAEGAVWLTINSGHAGAQGDYDAAAVKAWQKKTGAAANAYLRDQDGKVGKLYDARHTPTLYIVNPAGTLVYAGGIDSINSTDTDDIPKATNYVKAALGDLKAGRPVAKATTKAYGCSVKY
jgi:cytochrome oxidase Cu insertion factor (SCO1/SenC/PrrC family)